MSIKIETLYLLDFKSEGELKDFDKKIQKKLDDLCEDGHSFISISTVSLGGANRNLRTEIAYKENQSRKVIVEKQK